jgi:ACS family hexuronate transporter-like MFS transporter
LFLYALLVLPVLAVSFAGDWMAVILIGVIGAAHQAWSANFFTHALRYVPRQTIASLVGIGSTAGAIGSMLFQFWCGHILDIYGAARAQDGYSLLFFYAAFAYLVAFGLQHLLAPRFEPVHLRANMH